MTSDIFPKLLLFHFVATEGASSSHVGINHIEWHEHDTTNSKAIVS